MDEYDQQQQTLKCPLTLAGKRQDRARYDHRQGLHLRQYNADAGGHSDAAAATSGACLDWESAGEDDGHSATNRAAVESGDSVGWRAADSSQHRGMVAQERQADAIIRLSMNHADRPMQN